MGIEETHCSNPDRSNPYPNDLRFLLPQVFGTLVGRRYIDLDQNLEPCSTEPTTDLPEPSRSNRRSGLPTAKSQVTASTPPRCASAPCAWRGPGEGKVERELCRGVSLAIQPLGNHHEAYKTQAFWGRHPKSPNNAWAGKETRTVAKAMKTGPGLLLCNMK